MIVEDQPPAQRVLTHYIEHMPHLRLLATCGNANEALASLHDHHIDLMFLDLNLPLVEGFDFLRSLPRPPQVIVTTAYSEHALEGYELEVLDYLVKPFSLERFMRAVSRARAFGGDEDEMALAAEDAEEVFVKVDHELRRVPLADIVYLR